MKRSQEKYLYDWYRRERRKPLIVRGARQVGKSTLVRNFASAHQLKLFEINLERHPELERNFATFNIKEIIRELEYICGQDILNSDNSLLFLDEIQAAPSAIQALRYFYEDQPQLPVVSAGSLMEFTLAEHSFSMPVGRVEYLFMGPMIFEEFLEARQEPKLLDLIRNYNISERFPESAHTLLLKQLRDYLIIGGMPEAVKEFLKNNENPAAAFNVHASIIETYFDDFAKYAKNKELLRLRRVFNYVPAAAGEKVKYSKIDPDDRARELKHAVELLIKARVIFPVYHTRAASVPLGAGKADRIYKLYFLDVGLMNHVCGINNISAEFMRERSFINEGKMAEQFIAQHLLYLEARNKTPDLYYWLREKRKGNAEVDFLIQNTAGGSSGFRNNTIVPVEVKAGKTGSLKSLQRFVYEKHVDSAIRFDLNLPSFYKTNSTITDTSGGSTDSRNIDKEKVSFNLLSLPLYMVQQTFRL